MTTRWSDPHRLPGPPPEIDGVPPSEPPDPEAASARVTELVADLVEPARTTALEKLGEGEQAQGIAIGWLRPRLLLATPA